MALKPTIYKANIALSDFDRHTFDSISLTIAQHPSETLERMMARMLAFCIHYEDLLAFTAGLSDVDTPDIWVKTLDDRITHWIDVGEPNADRLKKASRQAEKVSVYSFNSKSDVWWAQEGKKIKEAGAAVFQFSWDSIQELASHVERTMDFSLTLTEMTAYFSFAGGDCAVSWRALS